MLFDLSTKQRDALTNSDARINLWEGAVRSGKSFSALLRFIEFCMSPIKGDFMIVGRTEDSLKRNIINELMRLIGSEAQYYSGNREVILWGRKIHVTGASDLRAENKIRGSTLAGALVDEVSIIPENFFTMLLSRLSVDGAMLFATTNPDSPYHWLKTNYIDRIDDLNMKRWHFDLDDNPSLTEDYKNNLKAEYRGLWYKRYIEGLWVLAEGSIYDFFEDKIHTIDFPPTKGQQYVVGIDYGTVNPCSFILIGTHGERYPRMWVEKEYYWASKENNRQKTDVEYAVDLLKFIEGYNIKAIYIDPSAASFIAECRKQDIRAIAETNNDVLDGIRFVSQLLTEGSLKICKCCTNLIKEIQTYVWDENAALHGIERPKKANDHCVDALRYCAMHWYRTGYSSTTPQELDLRYRKALCKDLDLPGVFQRPAYMR